MENAREYYDKLSKIYDRLYGPEQVKKLDKIEFELKKIIRYKRFRKGIDLGCGTGISTSYLKKFCKEVVGIDFSKEMIKKAKRMEFKNCKFYIKDIRRIFSGKYDIVFAITVLQDLNFPSKALKIIKKICKKHTIVIISVLRNKGYRWWKKKVLKYFRIIREIFDEKDFIFICKLIQ